jgi:hypothetical protein
MKDAFLNNPFHLLFYFLSISLSYQNKIIYYYDKTIYGVLGNYSDLIYFCIPFRIHIPRRIIKWDRFKVNRIIIIFPFPY